MAIKPIPEHFSMTNMHPSVHDEESMTALELAGRLNGKVNECVNKINEVDKTVTDKLANIDEEIANRFDDQDDVIEEAAAKVAKQMEEQVQQMIEHETETIPDTVDAQIRAFISSGQFDPAIRTYLSYLEERLDNLMQSYFPGDTTANAELFDLRLGYNGYNGGTAGKTIRYLMAELSNRIDSLFEVTYTGHTGYLVLTTGQNSVTGANELSIGYQDTMDYYCKVSSLIPCKPHERFFYAGRSEGNAIGVVWYNNGVIINGQTFGVNNTVTMFIVPENATHVQFSSFADVDDMIYLHVWRMSDRGKDYDRAYDSERYIQSNLNAIEIKEIDGYLAVLNNTFVIEDGDPHYYHGKRTDKIPCNEGDKFIYRGRGEFNAVSCIMFNAKNEVVNSYQYTTVQTITIPADVHYVQFASFNDASKPVVLEVSKVNTPAGIVTNPLYNKEIAFNGDSIMAGDGFAGGFAKIIADRNHMVYSNVARGGATIATGTTNADGSNRHYICSSISSMSSTADYVIINGGVNDAWNNVALGTFVEGYNGDGDTRTFYGAFDYMCRQMALGLWGKKYGYIFPHNCNSGLDTGKDYYNAAKRVLEKWGIPYLDLSTQLPPFGHTKSLPLISTLQEIYIPDGVHPNEAGYKKYYCDKIESWLKTL